MICIECTNPNIKSLYSKYKSDYIRLTICPRCGKIADKYIEFDNVILFIDLLLLKKQACRHLAYNITETELLKDPLTRVDYVEEDSLSKVQQLFNFIKRYRTILRLVVMILLFEVYLVWAYEEKNPNHSLAMSFILGQKIHDQYLFFIVKLMTEQFLLSFLIQVFYGWFLGWGKVTNTMLNSRFQSGYYNSVLLTTILVSYSIKLFPILMLIWPYDNTSISITIIDFVRLINMIESLRIVTNQNYVVITSILLFSTVIQVAVSKVVLSVVVSYWSGFALEVLLRDEWMEFLHIGRKYEELVGLFENIW